MPVRAPQEPAVMTRAYKRGACWYVEGVVQRNGTWLKAAFTAYAPDIEHMSPEKFREFAERTLPSVTEDKSWEHSM